MVVNMHNKQEITNNIKIPNNNLEKLKNFFNPTTIIVFDITLTVKF